MSKTSFLALQVLVFSLVASAFANVYITQPVLPVIRGEFGVSASVASLTVSAVILGIALANLPFGMLADRFPVQVLILVGGLVVAGAGLVCAATPYLGMLVAARFVQGLFLPALTTCLAAYLAANLPLERLNVVMGSYVASTVVGGLIGRLLGGWIHPPLHWRYAFVTASVLLVATSLVAARWLPPEERRSDVDGAVGFGSLLSRADLRRVLLAPFGGFFVFSSIFNYLPFYLAAPPFGASTEMITLLYLTYLLGVLMGPVSGKISNRLGNGATIILGCGIFALAILITLIKSVAAVVAALALVCTGFFTIHAAAAGALNRKLASGHGRANSLYVLVYYLGGAGGISVSGYAYGAWGWPGVAGLGFLMLSLPLYTGLKERRGEMS
jgi:YNFM family putative membrane transporter